MPAEWVDKQRILFLAAGATGTAQLDREARSIQAEIAATGHRDCFDFVTRWAAEPLDLLRELRTLKPTVVHFSGHGGARQVQPAAPGSPGGEDEHRRAGEEAESGLYFVGSAGKAQWVSAAAIADTFRAAGTSVKLVVLNARYSDAQADALLRHVPCVIWMARSLNDEAARSFAMGFYGGLGDGVSVDSAYNHGCAAIGLAGLPYADHPRLRARPGTDATQLIFAANQPEATAPAAARPATGRPTRATLHLKDSRRRRMAMGIRTAFADGQGAYLLAMLAFGVAATFLYRSLRPERQYHEALASLLIQEQEPYRAETHPVLATGLLSSAGWDLCENTKLLDETDQVVRQFTADLRPALRDGPPPGSLVECDRDKMPKCPYKTTTLGHALTDSADDSTLIVPSTVAELVRAKPAAEAILLASQRIERYTNLLQSELGSAILKNMYFVDLAGGIRIIPPWPSDNLPAHRTFAGAGYMYETLSDVPPACPEHPGSGSRTLTRVYLDLGGMGVVRTLCHKIIPDGQVVGVLCFDFSPPEQTIYQMLDRAAKLFDLQLVRFYNDRSQQECERITGCPKSLARLSSGEAADLEYEWNKRNDRQADGTNSLMMFDGNRYFGATVQHMGAQSGRAWRAVVFGRVRRSPTRDLACALMMMLFATIASGSIIVGVRKKAKRLDVALIRGLQVGVVELDIRDTIVGANDRAQEIFGVELPAFDIPKRRAARPFGSLIHHTIVLLDDAGLLPPGPVTFSRYESLKLERAIGHSSSYYAITTLSKQVIRISGSTFVSPNMDVHTFGTIETFVDRAHKDMVLAAFDALADAAQRTADKEGV